MDLGLSDKVYMVAGASRGLGYGIAKVLAEEGARVAISSRDQQAIMAAADKLIAETGAQVLGYACDVTEPDSISGWVQAVTTRFGRIDGLVVNGGGPPPGNFDDFDDGQWQAAFELTLLSAVRLIRQALPTLKSNGGGAILALTSSSVKEPIEYLLLSNVMRSGVTSLTKSLSRELAQYDIRVNNLVPGLIETDRINDLVATGAAMNNVSEAQSRQNMEAPIPLGRMGRTDEFGRVGAFLLSPAAAYVTGATVVVDGGTMKTVW